MTNQGSAKAVQTLVGAGIVLIGLALAAGAISIPSGAGYGGVGPNFLPWVVAIVLLTCGVLIVREALTGGFRQLDAPGGAERGWWPGLAWISAGLLSSAALITTVGFIPSCTLCYVLAVQGMRRSQAQPAPLGKLPIDIFGGVALSAPVYWIFTKFLAINLPGLTATGWI